MLIEALRQPIVGCARGRHLQLPRTGLVSHLLEISYCSTTTAVGRNLADKIREEVGCSSLIILARPITRKPGGGTQECGNEAEVYYEAKRLVDELVSLILAGCTGQVRHGHDRARTAQLSTIGS